MSSRQIIWLTIFALMLIGNHLDRLNLGGFLLLVFIGAGLVRIFDSEYNTPKVAPAREPTEPEDEDLELDDVIRIRRRNVELLRNALMRHHNSRGADKDYQLSAASRETTEILQVLNAALTKQRQKIAANTH